MLPDFECIIFDSERIDALTLTSKNVAGRAMISGIYHRFGSESDELAFQKNWQALGYRGFQVGSVRWGSRLDSSALFSSGSDAMKICHILINDFDYLELNTTRVDVCIDVALALPQRGWLRALRESEVFVSATEKAGRKTTLIESDTGDTLYIGSRTSGRFGRIYDKSLAYDCPLGFVYRFEIETKKQVAPAVFDRLFPEAEDSTYSWDVFGQRCRSILQTQFREWGVGLNLSAKTTEQIRAKASVSTADSQLEWLSRSVKPVLVKLEKAGLQSEMFEAIGYPLMEVGL